jgi:hypothetical protein
VIEDLAGYREYLVHPAHLNTDRVGLPLVDKFMSFDICDGPDPELGAKIEALHRASLRDHGGDQPVGCRSPRVRRSAAPGVA